MPNWCSNIVYVKGTAEVREKIEEIFSKEEPFAEVMPEPNYDEVAVPWSLHKVLSAKRNEIELEEPKPGRKNAWYDWRIANWGTKWEPDGEVYAIADNLDSGEEVLNLSLYTAWGPPEGIFKELSKMEGVEEVVSHFYEPAMEFVGIKFYQDGDAVDELDLELEDYTELLEKADNKEKENLTEEDRWVQNLADLFDIRDTLIPF